MHVEDVRKFCLEKPGVTECYPFDEVTMVMKVMSKMFLLLNVDSFPASLNIKADPEKAVEMREKYDSVTPGFHMNKKHWNTVVLDNTVPDIIIRRWIEDSYNLVSSGLKKTEKDELCRLSSIQRRGI